MRQAGCNSASAKPSQMFRVLCFLCGSCRVTGRLIDKPEIDARLSGGMPFHANNPIGHIRLRKDDNLIVVLGIRTVDFASK